MAKRLFDICFAALVLVLLGPAMIAIAVWVRIDSPGPALFRQERVGRRGRTFRVLKFRTMRVTSGGGAQITVGADPRITGAGRFLRDYKLDELPQFINVLVGQMSVVGPRPEVPRYVAGYPADVRDVVLGIRPGITDLASIEFRDESRILAKSDDPERTYREVVLPRKLQYYAEYAKNINLINDMKIILLTAEAVLRRSKT